MLYVKRRLGEAVLVLSLRMTVDGHRTEGAVDVVPLKDANGIARLREHALRVVREGEKGYALRVATRVEYTATALTNRKWVGGMNFLRRRV